MREKGNEMDEMTRVQRELDTMAEEVPEMPEEFRKAWRLAIREEAANRAADTGRTPTVIPQEDGHRIAAVHREEDRDTEEERENRERTLRLLRTRRWTGILSAAAAMVFLIGGTLATRNTLSPRLRANRAGTTEEPAGNPAEETLWPMTDVLNNSMDMTLDAKGMMLEVPLTQDFGETEEDAEESAAEPEAEAEKASEESADTDKAGNAEEPPVAEKNSFWTETGYFLEDMGAFLKAALPYLIGAAAAAAVILLVRKRKRK